MRYYKNDEGPYCNCYFMLHCICFTTYQYCHLNYIIIYWSTGHWATTAARMAPGQFPLGIRLVRCQGHGPYQNSLKILSISCQIKKLSKVGLKILIGT